MKRGLRLTNIKGIEVRLDWTLLIIGSLLTFTLATGYFPQVLPGWESSTYLIAALFSCAGLFGSIFLHELAHAVVAQKRGIKVEYITLYLFGGRASLKEEPRRPRDEFWIAVVGPLASLNLAGLFFLISSFFGQPNPAIGAITGYLAVVNFMLVLFNLLPAFPLDGGRILRALVWGRTGNLMKATQWASTSGKVFGWGFVGLGIFLTLNGFFFDGLWLALIGWFLTSSARLSYAQTLVNTGLQGLTVGQVMWQSGPTLHPKMRLSEVLPFFLQVERGRLLPVIEDGYLVGVVHPDHIRKHTPAEWAQLWVTDVMTRRGSLLALRPDDDLQDAVKQMNERPALFAPVIGRWGQFAGMLYLADIPRYLDMQYRFNLVNTDRPTQPLPNREPVGAGTGTDKNSPYELDKTA